MQQDILTVIVPIQPGETPALADILEPIGQHIGTTQELRFADSPSTHFARLVILESAEGAGDRLLFSCCYDGALETYLAELVGVAGGGLDKIWSKCVGYAAGSALDPGRLTPFIRNHALAAPFYRPEILLCAFPGVSAQQIKANILRRDIFETLLDNVRSQPWFASIATLLPRVTLPPTAPAKAAFWQPLLERMINWLVGVTPGAGQGNNVLSTRPALFAMEDQVVQNQMTIISAVKPGLLPQIILRAVLGTGHLVNHPIKGTFSGVSTIHFARWILIDNGKNLLFESNYDGSWESYIDDFGDLASFGMNAIWGNCSGFPAGGSVDIDAFKIVIRNHQHPAQVFYSAYPETTVANIYNDLQVNQALETLTQSSSFPPFAAGVYSSAL